MKPTRLRGIFLAMFAAGAAAGAPACAKTAGTEGTDSNTHWLASCGSDADCGGLECYCGVCTARCTTKAACERFGGAPLCALPEGCAEQNDSACLAACSTDDDCRGVSPAGTTLVCHSGQCVASSANPQPVPCSATTEDGDPCTGDATCERACVGGYAGRLYCSDGHWLAGLGLFPCGADAGSDAPTGPRTAPPATADASPTAPHDGGSTTDPLDARASISTSCLINSDCSLAANSCCGPCRLDSEVVAVANYSVDAVRESMCTGGEQCAECVPPAYAVQAICAGYHCEPRHTFVYAPCLRDEDCTLAPRNCCQCSGFAGGYQLAAVNSSYLGEFQKTMCQSNEVCQCEPTFPDWAHARCNLSAGACELLVNPGH